MRRYLVVANQTLAGAHLEREVRERLAAGPCSFHVVVPATPPQEWVTWTEGGARDVARHRLDAALARFRALGADVDGEVGDPMPLLAVEDAVREGTFDEVIVSTLPPRLSRWLRLDLPHRIERNWGLPVTHVVGEPEPVAEAS